MRGLYFISDEAYQHLLYLATEQKYIKEGSMTNKGFSEFLRDLPVYCQTYSDNRPQHISQYHEACIKRMVAPHWGNFGDVRKVRCLTIDHKTQNRYIRIARQFSIILDRPFIQGRTTLRQPPTIVSQVLEGIGLQWIVPEKLPLKGWMNYVNPQISSQP